MPIPDNRPRKMFGLKASSWSFQQACPLSNGIPVHESAEFILAPKQMFSFGVTTKIYWTPRCDLEVSEPLRVGWLRDRELSSGLQSQ